MHPDGYLSPGGMHRQGNTAKRDASCRLPLPFKGCAARAASTFGVGGWETELHLEPKWQQMQP